MEKENNIYPAIIIGMGIGGITASIYLSRMGVDPLCLEADRLGGKINQIEIVTDYPGFKGTGQELIQALKNQLDENKIDVRYEKVTAVLKNDDNTFTVKTNNSKYITHSLIIASGMSYKDVPQIEGINNSIVSYTPMDSREEIKGKDIIVWGSSNKTLQSALTLSKYANKVYLLLNKIRSTIECPLYFEKLLDVPNIEILEGKIKLIEKKKDSYNFYISLFSNEEKTISASKLFPLFSTKFQKANTDFLLNLHEIIDDQDNIAVNNNSKTFIDGVYAVGDIQQKTIKNIATAILDGSFAGINDYHYLTDNNLVNKE